MIKSIQGKLPAFMHVMTPDGKISYRVDDYIAYVRAIKKRFLEAVERDVEIYPEVTNHCDICNWWEECNKRRRIDDHLSFIAGYCRSSMGASSPTPARTGKWSSRVPGLHRSITLQNRC